jgi:putative peptidoglycan lipid II flippase
VLQPAFYAIEKRWFPMIASIMALFVNIGCNYAFVFVFKWGHESLALTTSIVASLNFLFLYAAMARYAGDIGTKGLIVAFLKIGLATAVMAAVCLFGNRLLLADLTAMPVLMKGIWLCGLIAVAAGAYFAVALLVKVDEVGEMVSLVKRKMGR